MTPTSCSHCLKLFDKVSAGRVVPPRVWAWRRAQGMAQAQERGILTLKIRARQRTQSQRSRTFRTFHFHARNVPGGVLVFSLQRLDVSSSYTRSAEVRPGPCACSASFLLLSCTPRLMVKCAVFLWQGGASRAHPLWQEGERFCKGKLQPCVPENKAW